MAIIIHPDGTRSVMDGPHGKLGLAQMQEAVGCYIELVYPATGGILVVNEEGLLQGLRTNPAASQLADRRIVGHAILAQPSEID